MVRGSSDVSAVTTWATDGIIHDLHLKNHLLNFTLFHFDIVLEVLASKFYFNIFQAPYSDIHFDAVSNKFYHLSVIVLSEKQVHETHRIDTLWNILSSHQTGSKMTLQTSKSTGKEIGASYNTQNSRNNFSQLSKRTRFYIQKDF